MRRCWRRSTATSPPASTGSSTACSSSATARSPTTAVPARLRSHLRRLRRGTGRSTPTILTGPYNYFNPWWHPFYRRGDLHSLQSVTKTITSVVIGAAVTRGEFPRLDTPVLNFFDASKVTNVDERKRRMTLRHLLTMTAGIDWNENLPYDDPNNTTAADGGELRLGPVHHRSPDGGRAGDTFPYNSGATQTARAHFHAATGKDIEEYAAAAPVRAAGHRALLLEALADGSRRYRRRPVPAAAGPRQDRLSLPADGEWDGKTVVVADVGAASVTPATDVSAQGVRYGYKWWLYPYGSEGRLAWAGYGFGGQRPLVFPNTTSSWCSRGGMCCPAGQASVLVQPSTACLPQLKGVGSNFTKLPTVGSAMEIRARPLFSFLLVDLFVIRRYCPQAMPHVSITVNGKARKAHVEPRLLLVHFLREHLFLTGTHVGCDTSQCGACTVLIDGRSVKSCTIFAVQADGSTSRPSRGSPQDGAAASAAAGLLGRARTAVRLLHAGMIMSAVEPSRATTRRRPSSEIREGICRQFLPLHRLSTHRQCHPARCAEAASARRRAEVNHGRLPFCRSSSAQRVKRREDPRLIQGRATYVDDLKLVGMQHMAFKRSDVAHGRIRSIDTSARAAMDGVEAVFTGAEIAEFLAPDADRHAVPVAAASRCGCRCRPLRRRAGSRRRRHAIAMWRATLLTRSSSSTTSLPAVVDPELAMTGKPTVIHRRLSRTTWPCRSCRAARASAPTARRSTTRRSTRPSPTPRSSSRSGWSITVSCPTRSSRAASWRTTSRAKATMTIWSSTQNPHILQDDDRGHERPGPASGARDRAGGRRRLRREDQHLRRGVRRGGGLEAAGHADQVDRGALRGVSSPRRTGATSLATSRWRPGATARCSA